MKYMGNEEERQLYLSMITENQREVLWKYHKEEKNSVLQNQIFGQSNEWELIDIKVNANYHDADQSEADKLYCECGKPLKYQYVLLDNVENKTLKLGVKHFEEHAGIPHSIAKQILKKKYQLDEWLDDILLTVKKHKQNNQLNIQYKQVIDDFMVKTNGAPIEQRIPLEQEVITEANLKLFHDFKSVELPLPTKIYKKIEKFIQKHKEKQDAEKRRKTLWANIHAKNKSRQPQVTKVIECQKRSNMAQSNEMNKGVTQLNREDIGACRLVVDKLFNKDNQIHFNTLYIQAREPMERLFKDFDKETVIKMIANSVKRHSNNKIRLDWEKKTFFKTGTKI